MIADPLAAADGLVLVSHRLCPYVQRAAISLAEKGVAFTRLDVDLGAKPAWFLAASPFGKVPLLRIETGAVLFESNVILEYLEETRRKPLHPLDPVERALERAWIEFGSGVLDAIARFYNASDEATLVTEARRLSGMLGRVEDALSDGPWFSGDRFGLVDVVFGPIFRYFDTFERIGEFGVLDGKPKIDAWRIRLAARPSIARAVAADYPERLEAFIAGRGSAMSARLASVSARGAA